MSFPRISGTQISMILSPSEGSSEPRDLALLWALFRGPILTTRCLRVSDLQARPGAPLPTPALNTELCPLAGEGISQLVLSQHFPICLAKPPANARVIGQMCGWVGVGGWGGLLLFPSLFVRKKLNHFSLCRKDPRISSGRRSRMEHGLEFDRRSLSWVQGRGQRRMGFR